ncbi:MAG: sensor histidine kinase, partial [Mycobacteriales bacterium]
FDVPVGDAGRAVTTIEDQGEPLAVLVHDVVVLDDPRLVAGVTAAAQLAVANARMQAQVQARVAELAASRRRIVEAGDEQRRRLAAELSSGAEQRLVDVDRLLGDLAAAADGAAPVGLSELQAEVRGALAELDEFAQGIRPSALGAGGLRAAIPVLAARATVPVAVEVSVGRLPPAVESAIFFFCSESLANVAKHAHATRASVDVVGVEGHVVATVDDDGVGGADPRGSGLRGLADRVEALGGTMDVADAAGGGTRLTASMPTAADGEGTG